MNRRKARDIGKIFREGVLIDEAIRKAAQEAVRVHKQAGLPLVVWRDGRIATVDPGEMETMTRKKRPRQPRKQA
jgi:hypothetical protein